MELSRSQPVSYTHLDVYKRQTLVWAFILFSSLGIGTGVGFIALLISTFAFMTRAFIEVIDEVSCDAMEGLTACGGTFWQKVCQGIVPTLSLIHIWTAPASAPTYLLLLRALFRSMIPL